jgi:tape measure domain-containing protein
MDSKGFVTGAEVVQQKLKQTGKQAKKTQSQFSVLDSQARKMGSLFAGGVGIGAVVVAFKRLSDTTITLRNRLRLVTKSTENLEDVYEAIVKVSNETRTSLKSNADLFNRLGRSTKKLGLTYKEQIGLTRGLNQALVISGAVGREAESGLIQLAQGLASGRLAGDELRSVLENLPKVAEVIANGMGVGIGRLRELGAEGKINAQNVVDAFKKAAPELAAEFALITPTIDQAFTVMNNNIIDMFGAFNKASGAGEAVARMLLVLANNLDIAAGAAGALATIVAGKLTVALVRMAAAFVLTPFGAIVTLVALAGAALALFGRTTEKTSKGVVTGWDKIKAGVGAMWDFVSPIFMLFKDALIFIKDALVNAFSSMEEGKSSSGILSGAIKLLVGWWTLLRNAVWFYYGAMKIIVKSVPGLVKKMVSKIKNSLIDLQLEFKKIPARLELFFLRKLDNLGPIVTKRIEDLEQDIKNIDAFGELFKDPVSVEEGKSVADQIRALVAEIKDADTIGESYRKRLLSIAEANEKAKRSTNSLDEAFGGTGEAIIIAQDILDDWNDALDDLKDSYNDVMRSMGHSQEVFFREFETGYKEMIKLAEATGLKVAEVWERYGNMIETVFKDQLAEAYNEDLDNATNWKDGIARASRDLAESIGSDADVMARAFETFASKTEDLLVDLFTGAEISLKAFVQAVSADFIRLGVQAKIIQPIAEKVFGMTSPDAQLGKLKFDASGALRVTMEEGVLQNLLTGGGKDPENPIGSVFSSSDSTLLGGEGSSEEGVVAAENRLFETSNGLTEAWDLFKDNAATVHEGFLGNFKAGLSQFSKGFGQLMNGDFVGGISNIVLGTLSSLSGVFGDLLSGLSSMINSFSSGDGGNSIGNLIGTIAGLFSEGGMSSSPTSVSSVPVSAFANAKHFASGGVTSGGIPAILHDNEAVVPLSKGRKIPVDMGDNDGKSSIVVQMTVNTPDADSFKRSQGQILAQMHEATTRAARRNG